MLIGGIMNFCIKMTYLSSKWNKTKQYLLNGAKFTFLGQTKNQKLLFIILTIIIIIITQLMTILLC